MTHKRRKPTRLPLAIMSVLLMIAFLAACSGSTTAGGGDQAAGGGEAAASEAAGAKPPAKCRSLGRPERAAGADAGADTTAGRRVYG